MGNVVSESNRNATIARTYFATGYLKSEQVVPVGIRALADSVWYSYDQFTIRSAMIGRAT